MKTVFLSASVPTVERSAEFHRVPNAHINIEEAVINLCRAIFNRGDRVVFGGHPSISPLVSMVASEFRNKAHDGKKLVIIYQSEAFRSAFLTKTLALLERLGTSEIHFTPAAGKERFDPTIKNVKQCVESLTEMRMSILGRAPDVMVCIGGMEGVKDEYDLFLRYSKTKHLPVLLLPYTGGATYNLAQAVEKPDNVRVIESQPLKAEISGKEIDLGIYPHAAISEEIVNNFFN